MSELGTAFSEAVRTVAGLSVDEQFQAQYLARKEFNALQRTLRRERQEMLRELAEKDAKLAEKTATIAELRRQIAELQGKS